MRYLGNKSKMIETIDSFLEENNVKKEGLVFCDAFSGTGTVSDYFSDFYNIISNDNLYFPSIMTESKINKHRIKFKGLNCCPFEHFNSLTKVKEGFVSKNYSPAGKEGRMYFSIENAGLIDTIREEIENWFNMGSINELEKKYLISCLVESASKVANVAGVYGSYLKKWDPRALKRMVFIDLDIINKKNSKKHQSFNESIIDLVNKKQVKGDILYLDPPYTKNKYTVQYHVLETIAKMDDPQVKGVTGGRDMSCYANDFTSLYTAMSSFEEVVRKSNFKYIILSYNSDGILSEEYIKNILLRYGKKETYKMEKFPYSRYRNSKSSNGEGHYESLFFIEKKESFNISSPFNYQGGKHDMIGFIKSNLPSYFCDFYDIFGGGLNVGVNVEAEKIIYNDLNFKVRELVEYLCKTETHILLKKFDNIKKRYNLNKFEKESYLRLREVYNKEKNKRQDILFMLMMYGFQQQLRFNSKYEYNNPIGQSSYNEKVKEKVVSFSNVAKTKNISFFSEDFDFFKNMINKNDFVYLDPPYLITLGSYNDGKRGFNGWSLDEEMRLLEFIDFLNKKGVNFMLSNVIHHKNKTNKMLQEWISKNNFKVIEKDGGTRKRKEVIILNY